MKQPSIPSVNLKEQHGPIREEIWSAVRRVLDQQNFILGQEVSELEKEFARLHDCEFAVGCASGSDALLLSLLALGIAPGDAVLVPAFTFFATAGSVVRLGARPVFVDIDPRTFHISAATAEEGLREKTGGRAAKALIPVHLYGQCADMTGLVQLASQRNLKIVEDAAQAVLARWKGRRAGSFGVTGCFSFYPTKNLAGIGDGGIVTTNDTALAEQLRALRNHGSPDKVQFARVGINSRLDTIQAAVLLVKLRHLEKWTAQRQQRADYYRQGLAQTGLVDAGAIYPTEHAPIVLPYCAPGAEHVYHQFTVRAYRRDELLTYLQANRVGAAVYYPVPLHRQPAFAQLQTAANCPEAERAAAEVLSLPTYPELQASQQDEVINQIKRFYSR